VNTFITDSGQVSREIVLNALVQPGLTVSRHAFTIAHVRIGLTLPT